MFITLCIASFLCSAVFAVPTSPCRPADNILPVTDEADCANGFYYVCDNGSWKRMSCKDGQVWDSDVKACVKMYPGYNCRKEYPEQRFSDICASKGNTSVLDPYDCSRFISCHNGEYRNVLTCPSDLYFNEEKQYCDYKYNVKCIQSKEALTEGCVPKAVPGNCNRFIDCDRKVPFERTCEFQSTYFSNRYKVCVWAFQLTDDEKIECGVKTP